MDDELYVSTGLRIKAGQLRRADQLAKTLNITRNRLFGVLIDTAAVQTLPSVSLIGLEKNNRHDAKFSQDQSITAVGA